MQINRQGPVQEVLMCAALDALQAEVEALRAEIDVQSYWGQRWEHQHQECQALKAELAALRRAAEEAPPRTPLFWVRLATDGTYEGPVHNNSIERIRRLSGAWKPLYLDEQPALPKEPA